MDEIMRRRDGLPSKRICHPTILIVEDHRRLRLELRHWLTITFPGCTIAEAESGEKAVTLARLYLPDIVLIDIVLPGISGIEATSQITAAVPKTKVVILSFREEADYQPAAQQAGAIRFIHKCEIASALAPLLAPLLNYPVAE